MNFGYFSYVQNDEGQNREKEEIYYIYTYFLDLKRIFKNLNSGECGSLTVGTWYCGECPSRVMGLRNCNCTSLPYSDEGGV